jgi:lysophospholipid acyltransferase (LPLAT)-like uncharacterized protein
MPVEEPQPETRRRRLARRSGVVVPHQPTVVQRLGAWVVFAVARMVMMTVRYSWNDPGNLLQSPLEKPAIFAIWHNRLALCMEGYRVYKQKRECVGMAALVSASKDGGFLAAILERFRVQPVRGSSSRRGPQALLELTSWAERGYDLAITPDGPRGPCYVVQEGVMSLAQLTGMSIVPFSYHLNWKIQIRSWDRFQIPLPFARCEMRVGRPLEVPRDVTPEQRAALRQRLETELRSITRD